MTKYSILVKIYNFGKTNIILECVYGLGGLLKGLFRAAVPLFKQGAKAVGRTALKTGAQVANDVLQGQDLKSSLKTRGSQARQELQNKAKQKMSKMIGGGKKNKRVTKKTTKRKVNKNMTKRLKGAILKKNSQFSTNKQRVNISS